MAVLGGGGLWPERCPKVGEGGGSGGLRAPFLGIVPLCHSAAPWAQGLPSTSPYVPWAPAPSSPHAWGALEMGWWPQCSRKIVATGAFSSFSPVLYQPDGSFMLFPLYLGPGTRGQYLRGSRAALSWCKQSVSALRLNTIQKKLELFSCPPSVDCFFFPRRSTIQEQHPLKIPL